MNASGTSGKAQTERFTCLRTIRPAAFCALRRQSDDALASSWPGLSRPFTTFICGGMTEARRRPSPLVKYKKCPCSDQREPEPLAECDWLAQVEIRECGKHSEGDHFLQGLELSGVVHLIAVTIGGHRQAIFNECKTPADQDHLKKRHLLVPQVPIPGSRHEDIGAGQQQDRR